MSENTSLRKEEHLDICLQQDVAFKEKTTGFERFYFVHNALPEINFSEVDCSTYFLDKPLSFPMMITAITGGFREAEKINAELAQVCEAQQIALGLGSQRQACENSNYWRSFSVVRDKAPTIPIVGNIGAAQVARLSDTEIIQHLVDLIKADALAVHLNPLQEVLQPEGNTHFRGVLAGLEKIVRSLEIPVIVKETGAGISHSVAKQLRQIGVRYVDVSGAGGTSWAGVESYRSKFPALAKKFWDWGIPTALSILEVSKVKGLRIIASGGISGGLDIAKAIALGADLAGAARILLKTLCLNGIKGLIELLESWKNELKTVMFLTGSKNLVQLKKARLINQNWEDVKSSMLRRKH
ncbi:type 2 isopentenyl-diphosphate Delta-isomerase [candidate division KSB1 bacterium]|nr:MAG: type 2 isopentenyl-diphosphate Delta-isomerase [candidate division KSB1 bacterium]